MTNSIGLRFSENAGRCLFVLYLLTARCVTGVLPVCYLAALAGEQTVVVSRHFVSTHRTQLFQVIVICVFHNLQSHTWYIHTCAYTQRPTHTRIHQRQRGTLSVQCKYEFLLVIYKERCEKAQPACTSVC